MAIRSGHINSEIPLVKVTRQGPESYSGSRMVGTIGPAGEGKVPELYISATRGNIEIKAGPPVSKKPAKPETEAPAEVNKAAGAETGATADEDNRANGPEDIKPGTPLAILKALQDCQINVDEADRLLRSLSP